MKCEIRSLLDENQIKQVETIKAKLVPKLLVQNVLEQTFNDLVLPFGAIIGTVFLLCS